MIYLDHCASAPLLPQAAADMQEIFSTVWGNPGALHQAGGRARAILQRSRRSIARLVCAADREVFFTSGGTESNNWAIKSGCQNGGRHIVVSAVEHASVLKAAEAMKRQGFSVSPVLPDSRGIISPESIDRVLRPDTALISIQAANNETGVLQDVASIGALAHSRGILFHCDAVQSFGHVVQDLSSADLISLSAHKLGGPAGIGALVIRSRCSLQPMLDGGGQELGLRSGTENVAGAAGFAAAAVFSAANLEYEQVRLPVLRDRLLRGIRQIAPRTAVNGDQAPRLPGVLNCRFPEISGEEMVVRLDLRGICVSPGAACSARDSSPSHVLLAMGLSEQQAKQSVRFSMGPDTTADQIDAVLDAISQILRSETF